MLARLPMTHDRDRTTAEAGTRGGAVPAAASVRAATGGARGDCPPHEEQRERSAPPENETVLSREDLSGLFDRHYLPLRLRAERYVGARAAAEGVVQDVFVRLWEHRRDVEQGELRAWLFRAVKNRALDVRDRQQTERAFARGEEAGAHEKRARLSWDLQPESPEAVFGARELEAAHDEAVGALPERRRHVYRLSREEGLSNGDIAERLGIKKGTVEMHLYRALRSIREALRRFAPKGALLLLAVWPFRAGIQALMDRGQALLQGLGLS